MGDLNNAFGDIIRACQDYNAGQIQIVIRDKNESPIAGVFATVEPELALLLESTIKTYEQQNSDTMERENTSPNSAMVPCQLWPTPNGGCPVGRVECYKYSACQVAQHQ